MLNWKTMKILIIRLPRRCERGRKCQNYVFEISLNLSFFNIFENWGRNWEKTRRLYPGALSGKTNVKYQLVWVSGSQTVEFAPNALTEI